MHQKHLLDVADEAADAADPDNASENIPHRLHLRRLPRTLEGMRLPYKPPLPIKTDVIAPH